MDGGREFWHGILFEEPNPTGSRPSDLIGLCRRWQHTTVWDGGRERVLGFTGKPKLEKHI